MEQLVDDTPDAIAAADAGHPVVDDPTAFVLGGSGGLRRRSAGALGTWLGLALVGVLVAIPLRGLYRFTGGTMEEGFMLYFPERIAKGDVPNVDFLHLYGPGLPARAHRLVRAVRLLAARRADVRPAPAPRDHPRPVRAGPGVGPRSPPRPSPCSPCST